MLQGNEKVKALCATDIQWRISNTNMRLKGDMMALKHGCEGNNGGATIVVQWSDGLGGYDWYLEVHDIINESGRIADFPIHYCPFCGIELATLED